MKLQDILFFVVYGYLFSMRKPRNFVLAGLLCLIAAIPLFATWTFFTAERLTWYAAGYLLTFIIISLFKSRAVQ